MVNFNFEKCNKSKKLNLLPSSKKKAGGDQPAAVSRCISSFASSESGCTVLDVIVPSIITEQSTTFASVIIAKDFPAIVYSTNNVTSLIRYSRAHNINGSSWPSIIGPENVIISSESGVDYIDTMAVTVGTKQFISFYRQTPTSNKIMYIVSNNEEGTSWGSSVTLVDSGIDTTATLYPWIFCPNDNKPIILFQKSDPDAGLYFYKSTDSLGTSWTGPVQIYAGNSSNAIISKVLDVKMISGRPAIIFREGSGAAQTLKYVRANNAEGTLWGSDKTISGDTFTSVYGSFRLNAALANLNGVPCVAANGNLPYGAYFLKATSVSGDVWEEFLPVANLDERAGEDICNNVQLFITEEENPYIITSAESSPTIMYAWKASDELGEKWDISKISIEGTFASGFVPAITNGLLVNGCPFTVYVNSGNQLKFEKSCGTDGLLWSGKVRRE